MLSVRCILGCIQPAAGRVVEMACARSTSSTILDARKRTREERPEAGPSDARIEQQHRIAPLQELSYPQKLAIQRPPPHPAMWHPASSTASTHEPRPVLHPVRTLPAAQPPMRQPPLGGPSLGSQGGRVSQAAAAQRHIFVGAVDPAAATCFTGLNACSTSASVAAAATQAAQAATAAAASQEAQADQAAAAADQANQALGQAEGAEGDAQFFEACGDAVLELGDQLVVTRLHGRTAFGFTPREVVGASIMALLPPGDHQPFAQTAQALLAMVAGRAVPSLAAVAGPHAVRVLHRVRCRNAATPPMVELVHVDSIITAMRSTQAGIPPKLTIASRCAYHQPAQRATGSFSAFPSGYIPRR